MKLFKRLSTFILSCALVLLVTPAKVQAQDFSSAKIDAAILYLETKGLYLGEILDYSLDSNAVIIHVQYNDSFISTVIYKELVNGDKETTVIEPHATDRFLFTTSGQVYIDNYYDADFTHYNNTASYDINNGTRSYASYFYSNLPAGVSESNFGAPSTTGTFTISVGAEIASSTILYISSKLAIHFCSNAQLRGVFNNVASHLINTAISYGVATQYINYTTTTRTDYSQSPNVITYEHKNHIRILYYSY